ncbi:MAG: hypothetical protein U0R24_04070 [Solirubrobacterales bacterium]
MHGRIATTSEFRELLSSSDLLVITDYPHKTACLHLDPSGCSHVQERSFEKKVVKNKEANGQYFRVADESAARARWRDLKLCSSAACGAAMRGRR